MTNERIVVFFKPSTTFQILTTPIQMTVNKIEPYTLTVEEEDEIPITVRAFHYKFEGHGHKKTQQLRKMNL